MKTFHFAFVPIEKGYKPYVHVREKKASPKWRRFRMMIKQLF